MILSLNPSAPPHILSKNIQSSSAGDSFAHHSRILLYLNQCTDMSQLKQIHAHTLRTTLPHHPYSLFLYSRILNFSSFGNLDYAYRVFEQIENPSSFMWNVLIRACAHNVVRKEQAIMLYYRMMEQEIVNPDKHTFPFVLKACAYLFALFEGQQLHGQLLKQGFQTDVYVNNSLIHFYASCGCLDSAEKVFDDMPERSLVSWNVMIDALVQLGEFDSALKWFREMQKSFDPDGYTMQSAISACAGLGALSLGMWAHAYMLRNLDLDVSVDVLVKNSLVDMYCKCGSLKMAKQVFEGMHTRNLTSWNSVILGFAMHGQAEEALKYFACLVKMETFAPNSITFVGVLSACNHRGMVNEGRKYFNLMITEYKIKPVLEHYGCMVDLLARTGFIDEALDLVKSMPMRPDAVIWRSLLDACCKNNVSVELSEGVAKQLLETEGGICSGVYVLLSRVYASASRWNDVGLVRKLMTDQGLTKEPGRLFAGSHG